MINLTSFEDLHHSIPFNRGAWYFISCVNFNRKKLFSLVPLSIDNATTKILSTNTALFQDCWKSEYQVMTICNCSNLFPAIF